MAIKSGFGGGTASLDLVVQVPVSTVRSTVSYFPTSKTFFVELVAEAGAVAEVITLYEASKLQDKFIVWYL